MNKIQITVSGAIILRINPETNKKEIFATQRGYGDYKDAWEIPGGKFEPGETPEACIVREIREELDTGIKSFDEKLDSLLSLKQSVKSAALFPSARLEIKESEVMDDLFAN